MNKVTLGILIGSLALNFALVGFIVGKESAPPPAFDPTRSYLKWSRSLDDQRFKELREVLRPHLGDRSRIRKLRKQNRELAALLESPDYDRAEIEAILGSMRNAHLAAQSQSHEAFLSFVDALSEDERASLADEMRKRRHGFRKGLGKRFNQRQDGNRPPYQAPPDKP